MAGRPDVWELVATLKSGKARGEEAIAATAEVLNLTDSKCELQSATTVIEGLLNGPDCG